MNDSIKALAARVYEFSDRAARDKNYAEKHPGEAVAAAAAFLLLNVELPDLTKGGMQSAAKKIVELVEKYRPDVCKQPAPPQPIPIPYPNIAAAQETIPPSRSAQNKVDMELLLSNLQKTRHDTVKNSIKNIR